MKLDEGCLIGNRFRLVRLLGRGGMGSVWLADHLTLELRCALKFIEGEALQDPNVRTRFEREARTVAQLRSPHVVRVLDHGVCEDTPYIAMEYLQGETLASRLQRTGRLDAEATYRIIAEVARGLSKAHAAGVVHRDLKPENIFLAQEDEGELAKVLDFGIAKLTAFPLSDTGTQTGSLLGTPFYMSPEQARGTRAVDHRADLWSLGVIAFECLTGKLPYESEALGDLLVQIIFDPLPVPSDIAPDLATDFDWWFARAAARSVEGRFQTAKALADALGDALGVGEKIPVPNISPRAPAPSISDDPPEKRPSSRPLRGQAPSPGSERELAGKRHPAEAPVALLAPTSGHGLVISDSDQANSSPENVGLSSTGESFARTNFAHSIKRFGSKHPVGLATAAGVATSFVVLSLMLAPSKRPADRGIGASELASRPGGALVPTQVDAPPRSTGPLVTPVFDVADMPPASSAAPRSNPSEPRKSGSEKSRPEPSKDRGSSERERRGKDIPSSVDFGI